MGFFDQASRKFAEVQKKTGDTIAVYKIQGQIKNIEDDIQKLYASIGEICYKACRAGKTPEGLETIYGNIDAMNADIKRLNSEIDTLNGLIRCPECDGPVNIGVKFCPNCGSKIPEELIPKIETCPVCGNVRGDGDRFCEKCGHQYDQSENTEIPEEKNNEDTAAEDNDTDAE